MRDIDYIATGASSILMDKAREAVGLRRWPGALFQRCGALGEVCWW